MKLYRVKLRGMKTSVSGTAYGDSYVIAENAEEAYQKAKSFVDTANLGFRDDRELESVELLADENQYGSTRNMVFL